MADRIRPVEEKVQSILVAFAQINVAAAACEAGVPASTMRYDLNKVKALLPVVSGRSETWAAAPACIGWADAGDEPAGGAPRVSCMRG